MGAISIAWKQEEKKQTISKSEGAFEDGTHEHLHSINLFLFTTNRVGFGYLSLVRLSNECANGEKVFMRMGSIYNFEQTTKYWNFH